MSRPGALLSAVLPAALLAACSTREPRRAPTPPPAPAPAALATDAEKPPALPPPNEADRLVEAHHRQWLSGDLEGARRLLLRVAEGHGARRSLRALAALRLAGIAEVTGDRRGALSQLDQVKLLAGSGHPLALEADDRRARILTATPLADVRGPVPGSVQLKGEVPASMARFRQAERLLASFHRIVVAPSLENINEVLRTKRRALAAAVAAFQELAAQGGPAAQAAAAFRIGAVYHHFAEALAFESPAELLPSLARRLNRQLRQESSTYLRRALTSYRLALRLPGHGPSALWHQLATREAETLELVLRTAAKKAGRP